MLYQPPCALLLHFSCFYHHVKTACSKRLTGKDLFIYPTKAANNNKVNKLLIIILNIFGIIEKNIYFCIMKLSSNENTKKIVRLRDIAEILSGVYVKNSPAGDLFCLQVKDLLMSSPETTATRIEYIPKLDRKSVV